MCMVCVCVTFCCSLQLTSLALAPLSFPLLGCSPCGGESGSGEGGDVKTKGVGGTSGWNEHG